MSTAFWVVMVKRKDGEVYADLHKTNGCIYLDREVAEESLGKLGDASRYFHVVELVADLPGPEVHLGKPV